MSKSKSLKNPGPTYNEKFVCSENPCSLGARVGYIQPIFYKRFDPFSLQIRKTGLKKQWSAGTPLGE